MPKINENPHEGKDSSFKIIERINYLRNDLGYREKKEEVKVKRSDDSFEKVVKRDHGYRNNSVKNISLSNKLT